MTTAARASSVRNLVLAALCSCAASAPPGELASARWELVDPGVTASLRGLSPVDDDVCWVSGAQGTVLRTRDGGAQWESVGPPGTEDLDFRDVQAVDADNAWIVTAGQPARIYRTRDGGRTWTLQHQSPHGDAFFDSAAFLDAQRGIVFGDPVGGSFHVLVTRDGGETWAEVPPARLPPPVAGEAGFAASGTCVAAVLPDRVWIGTGGGAARVLRSQDGGETWEAAHTPVVAGQPSRGIFSVAFADALHGVVVGGDYREPDGQGRYAAWSADGGASWTPAEKGPGGYRSGVAAVPGVDAYLAVGLNGSDWSWDGGRTWIPVAEGVGDLHAVAFGAHGGGWAVGANGRIARLVRAPH